MNDEDLVDGLQVDCLVESIISSTMGKGVQNLDLSVSILLFLFRKKYTCGQASLKWGAQAASRVDGTCG